MKLAKSLPLKQYPVILTLKAPITTAADDILSVLFHCISEKIRLDISSESSARHMKNQALFSSKDKSKKLKCRLLQFLFGALRVKNLIRLLTLIRLLSTKKFDTRVYDH